MHGSIIGKFSRSIEHFNQFTLVFFFIVHKAIYVILKILSKHIQVGSCFEDLIERNTVAQSEFEFDVWFKNYNFFKF